MTPRRAKTKNARRTPASRRNGDHRNGAGAAVAQADPEIEAPSDDDASGADADTASDRSDADPTALGPDGASDGLDAAAGDDDTEAGAARPRRTRSRRGRADVPQLSTVLESVLFATDRPVTVAELMQTVPEADADAIRGALDELRDFYEDRGLDLQEMAGGYQLVTRPEYATYVERFLVGKRRTRLSRAALESLATIAYRQPITRGEIEELRGVDSGHVLHTLMSRDLVAVKGRSEDLGRPLLYGTTAEFLAYFGLNSLGDLPNLEEFEALSGEDPLEDPEIRSTLESHGLLAEPDAAAEASAGVADEREGELPQKETDAPDGAQDHEETYEDSDDSDDADDANTTQPLADQEYEDGADHADHRRNASIGAVEDPPSDPGEDHDETAERSFEAP